VQGSTAHVFTLASNIDRDGLPVLVRQEVEVGSCHLQWVLAVRAASEALLKYSCARAVRVAAFLKESASSASLAR
jgi:hypothetical protein